jgi:hypothetical protein
MQDNGPVEQQFRPVRQAAPKPVWSGVRRPNDHPLKHRSVVSFQESQHD